MKLDRDVIENNPRRYLANQIDQERAGHVGQLGFVGTDPLPDPEIHKLTIREHTVGEW